MIHYWSPQIKSDIFPHRTHRVNKDQLLVIGLIDFLNAQSLKDYVRDKQQSSVIHHWNHELNPDYFPHRNHRVN